MKTWMQRWWWLSVEIRYSARRLVNLEGGSMEWRAEYAVLQELCGAADNLDAERQPEFAS